MNCHEKTIRSMSSSLPNRSAFPDEPKELNLNYTIFSDNIKNPPKLTVSDDGSGTASNPKNIINNRRRSESFAVYSGQDHLTSSPTQSSFNEAYFNALGPSDDVSFAYYSPENLQQNIFPNNLNVDKKIVLYKTEMCRTFEETGTCKYGTKCQFAHDPNEIRNIPRHPRYKTEICKTFWQLGNCPYGKRCCFIHTENELRDQRKTTSTMSQADIYGSADLIVTEDAGLNQIQSHNSSRSASPNKLAEAGKMAEDLKKAISNIGDDSIFNDLSISNLPKMSSIANIRRKSIFDDKLDELAILVGSNCSINPKETDSAAPNSEDPEFKSIYKNQFELWTCDSPKLFEEDEEQESKENTASSSSSSANNKYTLFDKSPGSRGIDSFSNGIWSKGSLNTFISDPPYFKSAEETAIPKTANLTIVSSGTSSSKSSSNCHQQLLIDMLNLLDSA
jgi:hypothetical protein